MSPTLAPIRLVVLCPSEILPLHMHAQVGLVAGRQAD